MKADKKAPIYFISRFLFGFGLLYGFNLIFIGLSVPGGVYFPWLDHHVNYIKTWRKFDIFLVYHLLKGLGYEVSFTTFHLKVYRHAGFHLVYSCLGYGLMSTFTAFVSAIPKSGKSKFIFLITGLFCIQLMNIGRLTLIALYWTPQLLFGLINHHHLFNFALYGLLILMTYVWIGFPSTKKQQQNDQNPAQKSI